MEHRLPATDATHHTGCFDNSLPPVLTIESGDVVVLETATSNDGQNFPEMTLEELLRLRSQGAGKGLSSHWLTGPIYVKGAEPGDVLEVEILRLLPQPYGMGYFLPGSDGLGTLPEEFPEGRIFGFRWEEGAETVPFARGVRLRLRPFLGVMGVAPAAAGLISSMAPDVHGGNMDLKELVEGTTLYLPVHVPGALFSTGDAHATQGDGEVTVTALETAMKEARLRFTVRKDVRLERPMAETPTHWITMGFHPDLDEAARIALRDAIAWMVANRGLDRGEAYQLASMAVDLRVTQLVDGNKGIHAMIPKELFE